MTDSSDIDWKKVNETLQRAGFTVEEVVRAFERRNPSTISVSIKDDDRDTVERIQAFVESQKRAPISVGKLSLVEEPSYSEAGVELGPDPALFEDEAEWCEALAGRNTPAHYQVLQRIVKHAYDHGRRATLRFHFQRMTIVSLFVLVGVVLGRDHLPDGAVPAFGFGWMTFGILVIVSLDRRKKRLQSAKRDGTR